MMTIWFSGSQLKCKNFSFPRRWFWSEFRWSCAETGVKVDSFQVPVPAELKQKNKPKKCCSCSQHSTFCYDTLSSAHTTVISHCASGPKCNNNLCCGDGGGGDCAYMVEHQINNLKKIFQKAKANQTIARRIYFTLLVGIDFQRSYWFSTKNKHVKY